MDFFEFVAALEEKNKRSDRKSHKHDYYENRRRFRTRIFHGLIKENLYVGGSASGKVSDDNIVSEKNSDGKKRRYSNTGNDIRNDYTEECVKFACTKHFRSFKKHRHIYRVHAVPDTLINMRKNDYAICAYKHYHSFAKDGTAFSVEREDRYGKDNTLNGIRNHAEDLEILFKIREINSYYKKSKQNKNNCKNYRNDTKKNGLINCNEKFLVGKNRYIVLKSKSGRNDSGPIFKKRINNSCYKRNKKPYDNAGHHDIC